MKKIISVLLLWNLLGCQYFKENKEVVTKNQLSGIIEQALFISHIHSGEVFIYQKYQNQENVDSLIAFYEYGRNIYSYKIKDSIENFVKGRTNRSIPKNLDVLSKYGIKFISDTVHFKGRYLLITEPFYIDNNKLLFLIKHKNISLTESWMCYLEKKQETFKVTSFFDFQKNRLFEVRKL